jgi:RNA polymerase sigma-70 factor, ECF subfamily
VDVEAFFRTVYPELFRYLHRLTGSADTADDIAQESFVRLLERRVEPEAEARRWLFTVAMNLVRDGARAGKRRRELLATGNAPEPSRPETPDAAAERGHDVARVRRALAGIGERDRTILLMHQEGFRYREIAEAVGVAPGSVGTLLGRALRRFTAAYHEQDDDDDGTSA